jgi:uncharacterized membrane protein
MEGLLFLTIIIVAAFIFAVTGVIILLSRTAGQAELLREYGKRIARLEEGPGSPAPDRTGAEVSASPAAAPMPVISGVETVFPAMDRPAVLETAASMPAADFAPPGEMASIPPETEPPEALASVPLAEIPAEPPPPSMPEAFVPARSGSSSALKNSLAAFVRGGNLWAAGGIILLIAAFAMLITYLANRGFFTVEMGIAGAAFSGLLMLALGWRFRKKRPVYFLLLQGGGIGILYLSIFAAHKLTSYFPPLVSLILMSFLMVPALILALFQGSQALALLGFLGGFAAPLLLASGGGNHVFLFAYYGVLDAGVLAISRFRRWKGLSLLAFLCTFILANSWTAFYYQPGLFWQTEPFFLAYIIIFTILGLDSFGAEENRRDIYFDLALVLGTPLAGAALQWKVFDSVPHGHALICLVFSAFYILLAFIIWKRRGGEMRIFSEGYIGLGLLLANLAVPLELAPRITSAVWAAEGAVVFFFGLRLKHLKTAAAGIILHLAAAIAFAAEQDIFAYGEGAFRSARFAGSLVIALSAMAMIVIAKPLPRFFPEKKDGPPVFPVILGLWAFTWWFGGWSCEIYRVLDNPGAVLFLFCSASALAALGAAKALGSPVYRLGMIPAPVFALFMTLAAFIPRAQDYPGYRPWMILSRNFFEGLFLWGWLIFFAVQALLLFFSRKDLREEIHGIWLLAVIFTALRVISSSGRALTLDRGLAPAWTSLAGMAPVFAVMIGIGLRVRRLRAEPEPAVNGNGPSPPAAGFRRTLILFILPLVLSGIMGIWFLVTLFFPGDPAPLPFYIPIVNPLDLEEAFCIVLFLLWQSALLKRRELPRLKKPALFVIIDIMIFLFAIAVTARSVHFYGDVPYRRVFNSDVFHLCLFILWAVYGIGHIIWGNRLSLRKLWIAGAILTVADIAKLLILDLAGTGALTRIVSFFIAGLLLLFIGWIAPLPPAEKTTQGKGHDG